MGKERTWVFLMHILLLFTSGCSPVPRPDGISEQEAIEAAVEIASASRPEISSGQTTPTNVRAERMALAEAIRHIGAGDEIPSGQAAELPVWLVSMDGIWLDEFPRPEDYPTPEPYRHLMIILNAKSGAEIESTFRP